MMSYGAAEGGLLAKFDLDIIITKAILLIHMSEQSITYFLRTTLVLQSWAK